MNVFNWIAVSSNVTNACSTSNINQIEELAADHENDERYEDAMYDDNTRTNEDTLLAYHLMANMM